MPSLKYLIIWIVMIMVATNQYAQAADPLSKPEANPMPRPEAKLPAKPKASSIVKQEAKPPSKPNASSLLPESRPASTPPLPGSGRKLILKKHLLPGHWYDISVFYEGVPEPAAGVRIKEIMLTPQLDKRDTDRVKALFLAHTLTMDGLEARYHGNYLDAEKHFKAAIASAEKFDNLNMALDTALLALGGLYLNMDMDVESEKLFRRCLAIRNEDEFEDEHDRGILIDGLAQAFIGQKKYAEADTCAKHALALFRELDPPVPEDVAKGLDTLGIVRLEQDKYTEADSLFREALILATKAKAQRDIAVLYDRLASVYGSKRLFKEALEQHKKALILIEKAFGTKHPQTGTCLANIGTCYAALHNFESAAEYLKQAYDIIASSMGPDNRRSKRLEAAYKVCLSRARQ